MITMHEYTRHYHLGCGERLQTGLSDNGNDKSDRKDVVNRFIVKSADKQKKTERSK